MSRNRSHRLSVLLSMALTGGFLLAALFALLTHPAVEVKERQINKPAPVSDVWSPAVEEETAPGERPPAPLPLAVEVEMAARGENGITAVPEPAAAVTTTRVDLPDKEVTALVSPQEPTMPQALTPVTVDSLPFDAAAAAAASRNAIQRDPLGRPFLHKPAHQALFTAQTLHFTPILPESGGLAGLGGGATADVGAPKPDHHATKLNPLLQGSAPITPGQVLSNTLPGSGQALTLSIELARVAVGEQVLFAAPSTAAPQIEANVVRYTHTQTLVEEFIALDEGIEQQWWLLADPGASGDLVITVDIATAVTVTLQGGNLLFSIVDENGDLTPVTAYSRAWAVDADGQSEWAAMHVEFIGADAAGQQQFRLSITLDEAWLAAAAYPILIDPLVSSVFRLEQETPKHDQQFPAVAYNPDADEYLLVWQDYRSGADWGIYGQRVAADGALRDENFIIADGAYNQQFPRIAYGDGVYLVTWRHYPGTSTYYYDAYASVISGTGGVLVNNIPISARSGLNDRETPTDVIYNPTVGRFLVLWQDYRTGYWNMWGRLVAANGSMGAAAQITFITNKNETNGAGAYNPINNQFIVLYEYEAQTGGQKDIRGRRINVVGSQTLSVLSGETIYVATGSADQGAVDVVYAAVAGQYLAVWQDNRQAATNGYDLYGRAISAGGSVGAEFAITTLAASEQNPRFADGVDAGTLLIWQRYNTGTSWDLYAHALSGSGQLSGSPFAVQESAYQQTGPVLVGRGDGEYLAVWHDDRYGASSGAGLGDDLARGWDIFIQRLHNDAPASGEALAHPAPGEQTQPQVAYNAVADEYFVVWQDYRSGTDWDIYGQRLDGSGNPLGENILIHTAPSTHQVAPQIAYGQAIDGGNGGYLVVWQHYTTESVYTIYGQRAAANGALLGAPLSFTRSTSDKNAKEKPTDIVYDAAAGRFLVVSQYQATQYADIWGWLVTGGGSVGAPIQVTSSASLHESNAVVAYHANAAQFLVLYERPDGYMKRDILGIRLSNAGAPFGAAINLAVGVTDDWGADLIYLPELGSYVAVWSGSVGSAQGNYHIYSQAISSGGIPNGSKRNVTTASGLAVSPRIAADGGGGALALWSFYLDGDYDLYGRRLDSELRAQGNVFTVLDLDGNQESPAPAVVGNGSDHYLLAWQDKAAGEWDLYAALLRPDTVITGLTAANDGPTALGSGTTLSATVAGGSNVAYAW
ncbi:MAG: hypothetical protein IAE79_17170, partial [Anaerolinea sp.]|nr:hypothetical protein [Anaerolinea sp.]